MALENITINGKKISDFKINCEMARRCSWMTNPSNVLDLYSLVRDYCSKNGLGCETKYSLMKEK